MSTEDAISNVFLSRSVMNDDGEAANIVDVVQRIASAGNRIADAMHKLGVGDAFTPMGAIEAHAKAVAEAGEGISAALGNVADAIRELADAVGGNDEP